MVDMLRKTADGGFERQDSDGKWVPVSAEEARAATAGTQAAPEPQVDSGGVATMIDSLVDELHGDGKTNGTAPKAEVAAGTPAETASTSAGSSAGGPTEAPAIDVESAPGDFDLEVPGLVSTDSGRSRKGFQTVRERLKENAKKRREPRRVEVGQAAAKAVGPAVREGTERRQQKRVQERLEAGKNPQVAAETGVRQRYVSRPAPSLFDGRPKWVQDLFESHFRSEHTLAMRRANNRMKISRMDYAIGWLTAFDKFREESSLLRLKSE